MDYWLLFYTLCCFLFDFNHVHCLFITDLHVPAIVDFRDNVTLTCSYNISDLLNSVKWYKDKMEFFRYTPLMHPMYMKFPVTGVQVQNGTYSCNESSCRLVLGALGSKSTGSYECEVSADAPHFQLAAKAANMTVAALPQIDPLIGDFNSNYRLDELISATCTSDHSSLPTKLTWYINDDMATPNELQHSIDTSIIAHDYLLRRQRLQLNFYINTARRHYAGKVLELKCVAEIENFPDLRRETTLSATLSSHYDINNQMLIHSSVRNGAQGSLQLISFFFGIVLSTLLCSRTFSMQTFCIFKV